MLQARLLSPPFPSLPERRTFNAAANWWVKLLEAPPGTGPKWPSGTPWTTKKRVQDVPSHRKWADIGSVCDHSNGNFRVYGVRWYRMVNVQYWSPMVVVCLSVNGNYITIEYYWHDFEFDSGISTTIGTFYLYGLRDIFPKWRVTISKMGQCNVPCHVMSMRIGSQRSFFGIWNRPKCGI